MRGLGNQRTVQELAQVVRAQDPPAVFLAKTWADEARLVDVCRELNFDEKWIVPRVTRGRGLALLWRNIVNLEVVSDSLNHIDVIVNQNKENAWQFTCIYGVPDQARKMETWDLLRNLKRKSNLPWVCVGDFNELLKSHEKLGGAPRSEVAMKGFREAMDECELLDLGYVGHKYTWRERRGDSIVLERLDRVLVSQTWLSLNPASRVLHVRTYSSDHYAIVLKPEGITSKPNKPFRFEQMWLKDAGCGETVKQAWNAPLSRTMTPVLHAQIKLYGEKLQDWSRRSFGSIKKQIQEKSKLLERAKVEVAKGADYMLVNRLKEEMNELLEKEALMWQQWQEFNT